MKTFTIEVRQTVEVTIDEAKMNEQTMAEFRESFYPFRTLEQHACHIAQMFARGLYPLHGPETFVEGYGRLGEAGIAVKVTDQDEEVIDG